MRDEGAAERRAESVEEVAKDLFAQYSEGEWDEADREIQDSFRQTAERVLEVGGQSIPPYFTEEVAPTNPREALLMILDEAPKPELGGYLAPRSSVTAIRELCWIGLKAGDREVDFAVVDKLAELYFLLERVRDTDISDELRAEIKDALMLPGEVLPGGWLGSRIMKMVERRRSVYKDKT